MTSSHARPTAAGLVAAVADFLDNQVRPTADGYLGFHVRVAANVLRIVERGLGDPAPQTASDALHRLGFGDEATLAAAIRAAKCDDHGTEVLACLRELVGHRLAIDHPGYNQP